MKKRWIYLLLVVSLFLCLVQGPVNAEAPAAGSGKTSSGSQAVLGTVVPEGVTQINLGAALGDDMYEVEYAWMLNEDVMVLLRRPLEAGDDEMIVLDLRENTVLSRTPVPYHTYNPEQGFEDGAFFLKMTPLNTDNYEESFSYLVKATVAPDGTVVIDTVPKGLTVMPGGKTAIREADGSLYAEDLITGKEELLIQGVPSMTSNSNGASYETFLKYMPWPDDVGYDEMTFPVDEETYYENDIFLWRDFSVYKPLDAYRFVYRVYGWEWGAGYGMYDLQTRTDHRITGRGDLCGMVGNTLYGSALKTDTDTLKSSPLPTSVQEQLEMANALEYDGGFTISPDGRLLALTGTKSPRSDVSTVTITDMETGDILKAYDIYNPFAWERSVSFYTDTRVMLFFSPKEHGSAYAYLFDAS